MYSLPKKIVFIVLFTAILQTVSAQVASADSIRYSQQLLRMEQQMMDDIPAGEQRHWNEYLHKDFFIVNEDGHVLSKEGLLATFHPLPVGYRGHINVINPRVLFDGNTAVVHYVSDEYENIFDSRIHTLYSSMNTYIKADTAWRMLSSQVFEIPMLPPPIKVARATLQQYTGVYQLSDSISCTISLEKDSLYYHRTGRNKMVLLAETHNVFFRQDDARGRKIFVVNDFGEMLLRERRNGQDVIWKRRKK